MSEIKINEATGLPEVAENYFWEVSPQTHPYRMSEYTVSLVRKPSRGYGNKLQRFFDETGKYDNKAVEQRGIDISDVVKYAKESNITFEDSMRRYILSATKTIVKRQQARLDEAAAFEAAKTFEGMYPPKSIND